jgi:cation:H+ antiporter
VALQAGAEQVWTSNIGLFIGGLLILGCGGECLVRGAAQLARQLGVSALVIGLTIVAFGTSAPEIAVTMQAAYLDQDNLAVANVVGSCIINILIVLGAAALVRPLRVSRNVITTDAPAMLLFSAIFILFATERTIYRWEGIFFVVTLALYTLVTYGEARRQPKLVEDEYEHDPRLVPRPWPINTLAVLIGIAGLVKGADLIVDGAVGIAELLGISTRIIGLTIVALGTSLPELATCVIAARRAQPDIAIGNIVGSNIFNILAVIGATSAVFPLSIATETLRFDIPVMLFVSLLSFWFLRTGHQISRREGVVLLALYGVYLAWMLSGKTEA